MGIKSKSCVAFVFWVLKHKHQNKNQNRDTKNKMFTKHIKTDQQNKCHLNVINPFRCVVWQICQFLYQPIHMNFIKQYLTLEHNSGSCVVSISIHSILPLLAAGLFNSRVVIYNLTTYPPTIQYELKTHTNSVCFVAFHPHHPLLATCSRDCTAIIYNMSTSPPTIQQHLKYHTDCVAFVTFHPSVPLLATCSWDNTIILYDLTTVPATIKDHLKNHYLVFDPQNVLLFPFIHNF